MVKKFLLLALIFIVLSSFTSSETSVYICSGKYSKKYHYKKDCRGLANCKSEINKVSLDEAKKFGKTLCGWED